MTPLVKNGLILIGLLVIGGLGYYLFVLNADSDLAFEGIGGANEAQLASEQFLKQLNDIKTFELSSELFEDQGFRALVDFSTPVPAHPVGRNNPFAPIE